MAKTITGIKAGTTRITATFTDGGVTKTSYVDFTVNQITPALSFSASSTSLYYTGSNQTIGKIFYGGDGTVSYAVVKATSQPSVPSSGWTTISSSDSGWTTVSGGKEINISSSSGTGEAGTYYVFLKSTAGTNYSAVSGFAAGSKVINKRTVSVSAPSINSNTLTYTKETKNLTTGGSCGAGGTMYYYASTSSSTPRWNNGSGWTTGSAQAVDAGTYNIWYYCYVSDTANNTSTSSTPYINTVYKLSSTKAIGQREVTLNWGDTTWTYDKSTHSTTCTAGNLCTGDTCNVTLSGNSVGAAVGTATVTASSLDNSNYKLPSTKTATLTITQREVTLSWGTASWVYDGSAHSTTCTAGNLCTGDSCDVTLSNNSITNVGSVTVTATGLSNSNYKLPSTKTKSISVTVRSITFKATDQSWTYDGSSHSASATAARVTGTGYALVSGHTATFTVSGSVGPNVGSATKTLSAVTITDASSNDVTSNYLITRQNGTLSISQRATTVTAGSASRAYNGTALTNNTASASNLVSGHSLTSWKCTGSQTSVGSSANVPSEAVIKSGTTDVTSNYDISYANGTLTVTTGTLTVTANAYSGTYDGANHAGITSISAKNQDGTTVSPTFTYCATQNGTYTSTIPTVKDYTTGTNIYWKAELSGYTTASGYVTATVAQKTATLSWGTVTWTYDGSAHGTTCEVSNLCTGDSCTVTLSGNSITNKGTTTVTASSLSNTNYKLPSSNTATLTINARAITITAASDSKPYDGSALTNSNVSATNLPSNHHVHSCTVTGTQTAYGSSSNVPSNAKIYKGTHGGSESDVTSNFTITYTNGTLSVSQREVTLTWGTLTWTYDGNAHSTTCTAGNVISGDTCTVTLSGNSITNKGTTTVTATSLSNSNYKLPSTKTATLTIEARPTTVTAASGTKPYDGSALTNSNASASNLVSGHHLHSCTVTGSQTSVGSSNNVPSNAKIYSGTHGGTETDVTSNYAISYTNGTLEVTSGTLTVTANAYSGTYDGNSHNAITSISAKNQNNTAVSPTYTYSTDGTNYSTTMPTVKNYTTGTTIYWKATLTGYTTASGYVTATVAQKEAALSWGTLTWTYDGTAHSTTCSVSNLCTGDSCTVTLSGNSITNKGTTTVTATGLSNTNYKLPSAKTATLTINARAVTVTAASGSKQYDGSALTNSNASASAQSGTSGMLSSHHLHSYSVSGSQTYVGSSNNTVSNAKIYSGTHNGTESDVTSNYSITYATGTLTVSKANPVVTVTGITADYTGGSFYATAKANAIGTLYWKKGSAPGTTSGTYDGSVKLSTLNTATNVTYVKDNSDDFNMYWLFVPSNSDNITSGQTYYDNFNNAGGGSSDYVNLTINPRDIANISVTATTVTYNGSSQTATLSAITDTGGNVTANDYTISGNTQTNAGTYTITFTGKNNYYGTKEISWTINKRAVTIVGASDSKTYDGTALTSNSASVSSSTPLGSGDHLHSYSVSGTQTVAGSANNVPSNAKIYKGTHSGTESDVSSNYTISYSNGTLTVNPMAITATASNQTKPYDGTALSADGTGSVSPALPSGHTITYNCTGSVGPDVGSATKTLSSVVIKNSGGTNVTSSFTVTKVNGTLSITSATCTVTYSTVASVSEYCTSTANAASSTDAVKTLEIGSQTATSNNTDSEATINYSTSQSGWTNNGTTLTIPKNTAAGTYNITVSATSPATTNFGEKTVTNNLTVTLTAVVLSDLEMTLVSDTVNYGSSTTVASVIATYNNGKYKDVKDDLTPNASTGNRINASPADIVEITTT